MLVGNGYYIVETEAEFVSKWSPNCNRFNYNAMPYDFDLGRASFPLALRFHDSFDPHFCGYYTIVPMAEAYDNILKAYEEEITRLMTSREKLKNLMKIPRYNKGANVPMNEITKLHEMLSNAGINHTFLMMDKDIFGADAMQIRMYRDETLQEELDDVVFHRSSYGYEQGLLETCNLGKGEGFETAEQVFEGWMEMFFS